MEALSKLSRDVQIILGGAVLYLIISFLGWQAYGPYSQSEWSGIGIIAGLLVLLLIGWEIARAYSIKIPVGDLSPGLISVALALLLALFTIITFLSHSSFRAWPSYVGLILSLAIGVLAFKRAKAEGVEMPTMPSSSSGGSTPS